MDVKSRHHLRSDAVSELETALEDGLGVTADGDTYELVEFEETDWEVVLIDGEPRVAYFDDEPFLTVRGANAYDPDRRLVTVDAGAVSFVSDGADVMRPGITEATDDIDPDDLVVIAEESHGKVLAIGRARVPGEEMTGDEGKVVDSLHHVGDELYEFSG
ncbi:RNA-binding protein, containing PUA domain [Halobiforma haloterrestris]|uniref:RNA-binding protein, containing PUA domain n=1 Tax=Natronobacterium haloterrestre TaxID=148448 RepID=A0A1I1ECB7_NATHA|nr:RNA-binding protein [Halobiforma haloterrestris]SFB83038.1 RNA-binding protein, containing PUA domain [Halobiforma haloterrestris]